MAPKPVYFDAHARRSLIGALNQYAAADMNSFRPNFDMWTLTQIWSKPYIIPGLRSIIRKQRILENYRSRKIPSYLGIAKILNSNLLHWEHSQYSEISTETAATIFHPPSNVVLTTPHIKRSDSKKTGPSAGLPIYGDENALSQFK